jgi:hypothetical protein
MRLADGEPLHVLTLPMPTRIMREGQRLPASYANFYIANSVVLLPVFNEHNDAWAVSALHEAFPSRRIVPIDCRELIWGLAHSIVSPNSNRLLRKPRPPQAFSELLKRKGQVPRPIEGRMKYEI